MCRATTDARLHGLLRNLPHLHPLPLVPTAILQRMRVLTLVGNRPQFVKAAAVSAHLRAQPRRGAGALGPALRRRAVGGVLPRAGAAGSRSASWASARAAPGSRSRGSCTRSSRCSPRRRPDLVLVYGDTNTTLAGALSCARLDLPLAHVESGMRSFDDSMPEERNRVLTDHLSDLLLCSTPDRRREPRARGRGRGRRAGRRRDGGRDADDRAGRGRASRTRSRDSAVEPGEYLLVTAHRAGNVDDPEELERLVEVLRGAAAARPLPGAPAHASAAASDAGCSARLEQADGLQLLPPLGYLDFLQLLRHARAVLTDSGGVQKEAYLLEVPCITLRETTEWTETVELGWNRLVGSRAASAVLAALADLEPPASHPDLYGGGQAGEAVVAAIGSAGPPTKLPPRGTRSGNPLRRRGGAWLRGPAPGARIHAGRQPRGRASIPTRAGSRRSGTRESYVEDVPQEELARAVSRRAADGDHQLRRPGRRRTRSRSACRPRWTRTASRTCAR